MGKRSKKNNMRENSYKGNHEKKDSRYSNKTSCWMLQTKIDTPSQKKIIPSDAPI